MWLKAWWVGKAANSGQRITIRVLLPGDPGGTQRPPRQRVAHNFLTVEQKEVLRRDTPIRQVRHGRAVPNAGGRTMGVGPIRWVFTEQDKDLAKT